jgi:prepilin-type N-terminal cleavage/methylation domain-containing protein
MKHVTTFRRSDRRCRGGFTLVELLFVIGIIALLVGILVPSLQKVREQTLRLQCGSNVREIARACRSYMMEDRMHRESVGGLMPAGKPEADPFDPDNGNIMGLRILLETQLIAAGTLVCPTAAKDLDHAEPRLEQDDDDLVLKNDKFINRAGQTTCSYGYLSMIAKSDDAKKVRRKSTIHHLPSSMIVVGDSNPRVEFNGSFDDNDEENSENHAGQGQNVGLLNESVEWIESPTEMGDDIYTSAKGENSVERDTVEDVLLIP